MMMRGWDEVEERKEVWKWWMHMHGGGGQFFLKGEGFGGDSRENAGP